MSRRILAGNAGSLLSAITNLFAMRSLQKERADRESKRHPVGNDDTGPDASTSYRIKRNISRSHASSLKKLDRAARIYNGDAHLKYGVPGKREVKILQRAALRAEMDLEYAASMA